MVRYAIVGAGQRGSGYAELIGRRPGAQVVAVAEPGRTSVHGWRASTG